MRRLLILICGVLSLLSARGQEERAQVLIETNKGKFVVELYNETPIHRDNFLRLVREGAYDGVIFHRIINNFVVQAGNLKSRGIKPGQELPEDSTELRLPAEIYADRLVHHRGALAAAREGDDVNPEKQSSPTQFYIVTGKYYTEFDLQGIMAKNGCEYTPEQMQSYMTEGGTPALDGGYTVFGRVVSGYGSVDKMQRVETDENNRPMKNVFIKRMSIVEGRKK